MYPAPTCKDPCPSPTRDGLSLIEVLVVLAILSLLAFVVCRSLMTVLETEQTSAHYRQARLMFSEMVNEVYLGKEPTNVVDVVHQGWNLDIRQVVEKYELTTNRWVVWVLSPEERPSLRFKFALKRDGS